VCSRVLCNCRVFCWLGHFFVMILCPLVSVFCGLASPPFRTIGGDEAFVGMERCPSSISYSSGREWSMDHHNVRGFKAEPKKNGSTCDTHLTEAVHSQSETELVRIHGFHKGVYPCLRQVFATRLCRTNMHSWTNMPTPLRQSHSATLARVVHRLHTD
jgi:hypothetical protein